MNKILAILKEHETDIKHRPRCLLACDYDSVIKEITQLIDKEITEAYKSGYIDSELNTSAV